MRLKDSDRLKILQAFESRRDLILKIHLFGSRTRNESRGGDIDLLLIARDPVAKQALVQAKSRLTVDLQKLLGERRIDLKFALESEMSTDPFLQSLGATILLGEF